MLRAWERLAAGTVALDDVYDTALVATGSEEEAADILSARLEMENKRR